MTGILDQVLLFGLAAGLSPMPALVAIVILLGARSKTKGLAYLCGWALGVLLLGVAALVASWTLGSKLLLPSPSPKPLLRMALGLAFLVLAVREWQSRPKESSEADLPGWVSGSERLSRRRVAVLGLALAVVNPKNLGLAIAMVLVITRSSLAIPGRIVSLLTFVALACVGVALPVIYFAALGDRAERHLVRIRAWLTANNAGLMSALFLLLAVLFIAGGLLDLLRA
jgi:hypothetical protein